MADRKPWQPTIDSPPGVNPFANPNAEKDPFINEPQLRDAEEDTAPLQGSKDLSDEDSLDDVVADQYEKPSSVSGTAKK